MIDQRPSSESATNRRPLSLLAIGASAAIALLIVNIGVTFHNTKKLRDEAKEVEHTYQVLTSLGNIISLTRDRESGVRTYVITGQLVYLEAYPAALADIQEQANAAALLTRDNPRQQAKIPVLRQRIAARMKVMDQTIAVYRGKGADAATQFVIEGQGTQAMDALQAVVAEMIQAEQNLLAERSQQHRRTYQIAQITGGISGVAALATILAFIMMLRQYLTSRAQSATVIAEQTERLRTTLASIGDAVITTDTEGRVTSLNAVAELLTGYQDDEAVGQPLSDVFEIVNEDSRQPVENPAIRTLAEGVIVGLANHTILIAKDGTERPIDDSAAPIRCREGEIVGCVLVFRDVTERRQYEIQLREGEARFRQIADTMPQMVWVTRADGYTEYFNHRWYEYTGCTPEESLGDSWSLPLHPDDQQTAIDTWEHAIQSGEPYEIEYRFRSHSGEYRWFLGRGLPVRDETGQITKWFGTCTDIEDFKRLEEERQKFVWLVDNSTEFIGISDLAGVPLYLNRAGRNMIGLDSMEEVQRVNLIDCFFPEDQSQISNEFLPAVLAQGHGRLEIRLRHFKTESALWMLYSVSVLINAQGEQMGLAIVGQDITERRHNEQELRQLAADLSEEDRRKDEFLATLAHELRNPLAPIRSGLEVMKLNTYDDRLEQVRAIMERQVIQMVRLVDDLLDMSRISRGKINLRREPVELSSIIEQAIETSRPLIDAAQHELTVTQPPQPLYLDADSVRIAQVIGNLLTNASKYSEPNGHIWLTAEQQGSEVVVSVKDTGIGLSPEIVPQIFDLFTQADGSAVRSQGGLGIGLTLVKRLVEMHGGSVSAYSEGPNQGSEFTVRLPILIDSSTSLVPPTEMSEPTTPTQTRRILIVDDNEDAAWSLELLFEATGDETRRAADGLAAVAEAEAFQPDIVLLDIGLPKLNGYEVARKIREQPWGKQMILVALTGWGQEEDRRRSSEAGFDAHMVKPIEHAALTQLLAELSA